MFIFLNIFTMLMLYGMGFFVGDNYDYELRTLCMERMASVRKIVLHPPEVSVCEGCI